MLGNKSDVDKKSVESNQAEVKNNFFNICIFRSNFWYCDNIAKQYAKSRNMMFYETSAKTASQVDVAFSALSKKLMEKR